MARTLARRTESVIEEAVALLTESPWWVSCLVAAVLYIGLRYLFPYLLLEYFLPQGGPDTATLPLHILHKGLVQTFVTLSAFFAPLSALLLLLLVLLSYIKIRRKRRLLDKQKGISSIRSLQWDEFEELTGEAFRRQGYSVRMTAKKGEPDGGIDLVLKKDGEITLVQCKHWKTRQVGVRVIRELYGVMAAEKAPKGILVISGSFTAATKAFAVGKPLELIDGEQLFYLIGKIQGKHTMPDTADVLYELCPKCGAEMVIRTARKGVYTGEQFWGCPRFPDCRGVRPCRA